MRDGARERWLLPAVSSQPGSSSILPIQGEPTKGHRASMGARAFRRVIIFSILALAGFVVIISTAGRAETIAFNQVVPDRPERTFILRGDLTASLALDLQAALRAGFRRVVVTSRGGEVLVARAMADLLNRHEAVLVAQGQCHSACTYMWLATRRRELGKDADLALHATFDNYGPNDFGELWLKELGRADLMPWARGTELHHLTRQELEPGTRVP